MTIAVDLGRKATKQTNKQTDEYHCTICVRSTNVLSVSYMVHIRFDRYTLHIRELTLLRLYLSRTDALSLGLLVRPSPPPR